MVVQVVSMVCSLKMHTLQERDVGKINWQVAVQLVHEPFLDESFRRKGLYVHSSTVIVEPILVCSRLNSVSMVSISWGVQTVTLDDSSDVHHRVSSKVTPYLRVVEEEASQETDNLLNVGELAVWETGMATHRGIRDPLLA